MDIDNTRLGGFYVYLAMQLFILAMVLKTEPKIEPLLKKFPVQPWFLTDF